VKLITWNIQWGRGCDGRVDLARVVSVLKVTADADVICLQEVAQNFPGLAGSHGEDEVALLTEAFPGFELVFAPGSDLPDGRGGRSRFGNALLTRLPLLQAWRHLLPWPPDPDVPSMQRSCVEAVVMWGDMPLRLMTTHLEYYSPRQRGAQMLALRDLHREACAHGRAQRQGGEGGNEDATFAMSPRPSSAVLCGDFNCTPQATERARLLAPFDDGTPAWCDAWSIARPNEPHAHTVGLHGAEWPDHPYCCDFICVTEDLAARVRDVAVNQATDASDHQPVVLTLG
jgi:endonuclease/exonuclease/phosphatase family metal-dependent hydrolase